MLQVGLCSTDCLWQWQTIAPCWITATLFALDIINKQTETYAFFSAHTIFVLLFVQVSVSVQILNFHSWSLYCAGGVILHTVKLTFMQYSNICQPLYFHIIQCIITSTNHVFISACYFLIGCTLFQNWILSFLEQFSTKSSPLKGDHFCKS